MERLSVRLYCQRHQFRTLPSPLIGNVQYLLSPVLIIGNANRQILFLQGIDQSCGSGLVLFEEFSDLMLVHPLVEHQVGQEHPLHGSQFVPCLVDIPVQPTPHCF